MALEELQSARYVDLLLTRPISPTVSITVSALREGGEQAMILEDFCSIWSSSPPEGADHLANALWLIEYDEDSMVVSIAEVSP